MVEKERPEVWDILASDQRTSGLLNRAPTLHRLVYKLSNQF